MRASSVAHCQSMYLMQMLTRKLSVLYLSEGMRVLIKKVLQNHLLGTAKARARAFQSEMIADVLLYYL